MLRETSGEAHRVRTEVMSLCRSNHTFNRGLWNVAVHTTKPGSGPRRSGLQAGEDLGPAAGIKSAALIFQGEPPKRAPSLVPNVCFLPR